MNDINALPKNGPVPAHPADVIALLARTNYRTVIKVLIALEAMHTHTGVPFPALVATDTAPSGPASFDGDEQHRVNATLRVARAMARDANLRPVSNVLYLNRDDFWPERRRNAR